MGVKNNIKLIFTYFLLNLKKEWQYKASFFMQIIMMIFNDLFLLIQWVIIFSLVDSFGGYGFREVLVLWAISAGGFGISHTFFAGAWNIKDLVYEGKLDVFLTQPKNLLINVCCSSTDISAIGDILYAYIVLMIIGAPWYWYLILLPVIILVGLLYVAMYVTYCSLCFYIKRGEALADSMEGAFQKASNYPPAIFSELVKIFFFTFLPVFFYSFIPAQYVFLTFNIWWVLILVGVVTLWILLAFFLFNRGVRRYNSGSLMGGRL